MPTSSRSAATVFQSTWSSISRPRGSGVFLGSFHGQEHVLGLGAAPVLAVGAVAAHYPVAGHHQRNGIGGAGAARRPHRSRVPGRSGHHGVALASPRRGSPSDESAPPAGTPSDSCRSTGTSKSRRRPAKYSSIWRATSSTRCDDRSTRGLMAVDSSTSTSSWFSHSNATRTSPAGVAARSSAPIGLSMVRYATSSNPSPSACSASRARNRARVASSSRAADLRSG